MAWESLAWQARLSSSSTVRGLGPACAARRIAGCQRARHHRPKPSRVVHARISVLSFQRQSVSLSAAALSCEVPAGVSTIRLGLAATCRVLAGRLLCSRWSSKVFHQTTSTDGNSIEPLREGTNASRSSRLPTRPRSLF
ncbi:hypothetical protein D3C71_1439180 [compost metagenome]